MKLKAVFGKTSACSDCFSGKEGTNLYPEKHRAFFRVALMHELKTCNSHCNHKLFSGLASRDSKLNVSRPRADSSVKGTSTKAKQFYKEANSFGSLLLTFLASVVFLPRQLVLAKYNDVARAHGPRGTLNYSRPISVYLSLWKTLVLKYHQ